MVEYLQPPSPGSDVVLVEYDDAWPTLYDQQAGLVRAALGDAVVELHHAGSTSVPGLAAKPVVDVVLVVPDPADEPSYVPPLVHAGFVLALREPEWYEHRVLRREEPRVNLHVFGPRCPEVNRMLAFRDRLRAYEADRLRYEEVKRELASRPWDGVQDYADAKSGVVEEILRRSRS